MSALIERIRQWAYQRPQADAVIMASHTVTYAELWAQIDSVAAELESTECRRLGIEASNHLDWLLVDLAAASLHIPVVPIPLFFSTEQRSHLISNSGIDTLYCGQGIVPCNGVDMLSALLPGSYRRLERSNGASDAAISKITYTSGSTGTPKGACLTESTLLTIVDALADALAPSALGSHLCLLPFATLLENVAGIYLPLWMGRSLVIDDNERLGLLSNHSFNPALFCSAVARYQAESVILLPQMLKILIESGELEALRSLKFIAVGGGKVAPAVLEQALTAGLPVFEGYGLTECGSCVALNTPGNAKVGSVGRPLKHANVRISGNGEVIVTGAAMQGYLGDTSTLTDIATGDAGYLDQDGYLYITGRIKNTIISSFGRNISPEWVESVFLASPDIGHIAVFGEAAPYLSAVIHVHDSCSNGQLRDIIRAINNTLPDYAQLRVWHRADKPFSASDGTLTSNGKLCRARIAEVYGHPLQQACGDAA